MNIKIVEILNLITYHSRMCYTSYLNFLGLRRIGSLWKILFGLIAETKIQEYTRFYSYACVPGLKVLYER